MRLKFRNNMSHFSFEIIKKEGESKARVGVIRTPHGDIETPAFTVVGTKGTVKALTNNMLRELGTQAVLANTYHLYLEPGDVRVKNGGGIAGFMNWNGPTLTDSGGFQVFSLGEAFGKRVSKVATELPSEVEEKTPAEREAQLAKIDEEGVTFRSHTDGAYHRFTPERSMEIQWNLGADIIFAFDECTSPNESDHYQAEALDRTHRWAKQSLEYHKSKPNSQRQALFGIVQGGRSEKLRKESAEYIGSLDFDGFGIGGSFDKEDMDKAVGWVNSILPEDKPRHLLGIGEPEDLFMAVENGCDLFDCVAPTRIARNGGAYTKNGKINLLNEKYRTELGSIDDTCECYTCKNFSASYIAHLFRSKEMLASTLTSIHNIYFISNMVSKMRESILQGTFDKYKKEFLADYLNY